MLTITAMSQKIFRLKLADEMTLGIPWAVHSRSQDRTIHKNDSISFESSSITAESEVFTKKRFFLKKSEHLSAFNATTFKRKESTIFSFRKTYLLPFWKLNAFRALTGFPTWFVLDLSSLQREKIVRFSRFLQTCGKH